MPRYEIVRREYRFLSLHTSRDFRSLGIGSLVIGGILALASWFRCIPHDPFNLLTHPIILYIITAAFVCFGLHATFSGSAISFDGEARVITRNTRIMGLWPYHKTIAFDQAQGITVTRQNYKWPAWNVWLRYREGKIIQEELIDHSNSYAYVHQLVDAMKGLIGCSASPIPPSWF